jgi:phage repressor protein C with HTH and peptisase S24 domain
MDAVRKRIARAIKDRGLDYKSVSLELGRNHAYVQQFMERGIPAKLPEELRARLSEMLDIPEAELGAPAGRSSRSDPQGDVANLRLRGGLGLGSPDGIPSEPGAKMADPNEIYADHVNGFWSFPPAVKAGWRNMPQVYSIPVEGDSMEPTLTSGSYVFVDMTHTVPQPEDIYACDYGDGLTIKRLQLVPRTDKIKVMADNDRYEDYVLRREDVRVYGRVVAWFQWRG